jgi:uncharacterized repeat protein (TIGR04076 family)
MTEMRLYDVRVTVERIEGRSVCGLEVGDFFEVTESSRVRIPRAALLPLSRSSRAAAPAREDAAAAEEDWLEQDNSSVAPIRTSGS